MFALQELLHVVPVYQYNFTLAANVHPYKISEKVLSDTTFHTFQVYSYFHHYTMQRSLTVTYCAYFALVWHLHCTLSMQQCSTGSQCS